jgi:hypothetical protein
MPQLIFPTNSGDISAPALCGGFFLPQRTVPASATVALDLIIDLNSPVQAEKTALQPAQTAGYRSQQLG